jgi:type IV secretory pathway TrbD component
MDSPIDGWTDFLTAAAGALGALAGLVFVSLSINLTSIIKFPGVTGRAANTMILLTGTLAGTLVLLIPHLSAPRLGLALLVVAVSTWILPIVIQIQALRGPSTDRPRYAVLRAVLHQAATVPSILASLSFCGLIPGGLYWFAAGLIAAILAAMFNGWVLLVEMVR